MTAIIRAENGQKYVSPVFAITKNKNWIDKKVVVFNSNYSHITKIECCKKEKLKFNSLLSQQVFIIENGKFSFANTSWEGLECIIANKVIMQKLKQNIQVSIKEISELEQYTEKIELPEWFEITNEHDIQNLLNISSFFHDATLEKAIEKENFLQLKLRILNNCLITLRFEDIIENNIIDKIGIILDSNIKKENGIRWEISNGWIGWTDGVNFDTKSNGAFISSKKLFWKIEIE